MEIKLYGQTVELEEMCDECWGEGTWDRFGKLITCEKCNGRGNVPSENGKAILEFIAKYGLSAADKE